MQHFSSRKMNLKMLCIIVVILYRSQRVNWAEYKIGLRLIIWFNFPFCVTLLKASTNIWIIHYSVKLSISQMVRSPTPYICYETTLFPLSDNFKHCYWEFGHKGILDLKWRFIANHFKSDFMHHFDGLVQDCSISSALAMEILQSCTKPSILDIFVSVFWNYEIWMFFSINHHFYVGSSFIYLQVIIVIMNLL